MKKKSTTFGMHAKKMADLLQVGSDELKTPEKPDKNKEKVDILNDILYAPLPVSLSDDQDHSDRSKGWKRTVEVLSADKVGKLLQDPKTDISLIRVIKDHGRKVSEDVESKAQHQAGNTIYFAAIAHALLFNDTRITKYSYIDLQKSFQGLTQQVWIPKWLIELFKKACAVPGEG